MSLLKYLTGPTCTSQKGFDQGGEQILLPVGVAAEAYPRKEKQPFAERAWFNAWGA